MKGLVRFVRLLFTVRFWKALWDLAEVVLTWFSGLLLKALLVVGGLVILAYFVDSVPRIYAKTVNFFTDSHWTSADKKWFLAQEHCDLPPSLCPGPCILRAVIDAEISPQEWTSGKFSDEKQRVFASGYDKCGTKKP